LDAKELERGLVLGEKFPMPTMDACICVVNRLSYYKHNVPTKAKFHVTLGHQTVMATCHFFCPMEDWAVPSTSTAAKPVVPVVTAGTEKAQKGKKFEAGTGTNPSLAMGCGALVADRQKHWPTSFDFNKNYLHLDELFLHNAPVEYENCDGDAVMLCPSKTPGVMEFHLNGELKSEVTELSFEASSGRLSIQDDIPVGSSIDSRGVVPLKDRDRVIFLLTWLAQTCMVPGLPECEEPLAYAVMLLEKPVMCPLGSLIIGSKLDFDTNSPNCRMAFFGRILADVNPKDLKSLRLTKMKSKSGFLERVDKQEPSLYICKDMFTAGTDMSLFMGLKVLHEASGAEGILEGLYGQEGHFKVRFRHALRGVEVDAKHNVKGEHRITLFFRKFDFAEKSRKIVQ